MRCRYRVTQVQQVQTSVTHRDRPAETITIENVLLEAIAGAPWQQSAAGQIRMSIDHPAAQGQFVEGQEIDVDLVVAG